MISCMRLDRISTAPQLRSLLCSGPSPTTLFINSVSSKVKDLLPAPDTCLPWKLVPVMATTMDVMAPCPHSQPQAGMCLSTLWDEEQLQVRFCPVPILRSPWPSQAIHVAWERPGQSLSIWGTVAEHMQWLGRIISQPRWSNLLGGLLPNPQ